MSTAGGPRQQGESDAPVRVEIVRVRVPFRDVLDIAWKVGLIYFVVWVLSKYLDVAAAVFLPAGK